LAEAATTTTSTHAAWRSIGRHACYLWGNSPLKIAHTCVHHCDGGYCTHTKVHVSYSATVPERPIYDVTCFQTFLSLFVIDVLEEIAGISSLIWLKYWLSSMQARILPRELRIQMIWILMKSFWHEMHNLNSNQTTPHLLVPCPTRTHTHTPHNVTGTHRHTIQRYITPNNTLSPYQTMQVDTPLSSWLNTSIKATLYYALPQKNLYPSSKLIHRTHPTLEDYASVQTTTSLHAALNNACCTLNYYCLSSDQRLNRSIVNVAGNSAFVVETEFTFRNLGL